MFTVLMLADMNEGEVNENLLHCDPQIALPVRRVLVVKDPIALNNVGAALPILQTRQLGLGSVLLTIGPVRHLLECARQDLTICHQHFSTAQKQGCCSNNWPTVCT